ncbi:MAG: hypothetical protein KKI08_06120 [Armatimonadetes bacterium]|nr:hypothetical protein [Armatimonadota bacterium]
MSATTSSPEAALASGDVLFWQAHTTLAAKHTSRGDTMNPSRCAAIILAALSLALAVRAATPEELAQQQALLKSMEVPPGQLMSASLDTPLVVDGRAKAVICHADDPAWRQVALTVQQAIADATGVTAPLVTDQQLAPDDFLKDGPVILLGHLDNNRHVARLYHNFFVCLDQGYTGRATCCARCTTPLAPGTTPFSWAGASPKAPRKRPRPSPQS